MKTLISMTDFVLENLRIGDISADKATSVVKYALFLKKPLKLEMFVPCDDGNILFSKPNYYDCFLNGSYVNHPQLINYENCVRYKKAEEKVLFEGFMNVDTRKAGQIYFALKQSHRKNNIDSIMNDAFGLFFYNASNEKSRLNTIEHLLNFHELILTESALKQIGI